MKTSYILNVQNVVRSILSCRLQEEVKETKHTVEIEGDKDYGYNIRITAHWNIKEENKMIMSACGSFNIETGEIKHVDFSTYVENKIGRGSNFRDPEVDNMDRYQLIKTLLAGIEVKMMILNSDKSLAA
jgi:hypothetical protein